MNATLNSPLRSRQIPRVLPLVLCALAGAIPQASQATLTVFGMVQHVSYNSLGATGGLFDRSTYVDSFSDLVTYSGAYTDFSLRTSVADGTATFEERMSSHGSLQYGVLVGGRIVSGFNSLFVAAPVGTLVRTRVRAHYTASVYGSSGSGAQATGYGNLGNDSRGVNNSSEDWQVDISSTTATWGSYDNVPGYEGQSFSYLSQYFSTPPFPYNVAEIQHKMEDFGGLTPMSWNMESSLTYTVTAEVVPEPISFAALGFGVGMLRLRRAKTG